MPKFEPKQIQKDLEAGQLWPVYWLYGHERMKSRELLKRIRKATLGLEDDKAGSSASAALGFAEETLDGSETHAAAVVDVAQSLSLGGGTRLVVVTDAHAIKDSEELAALLGPKAKREDLPCVCVFLSKDLDGRKRFSKLLLEKAAVVACEDVLEEDRDAWIAYLAKCRGLELEPTILARLRSMDPWSLDIMDQELEKYETALPQDAAETILGSGGEQAGSETFLDALLQRNLPLAEQSLESFVDSPEESLPLLGLLSWNVRQLALVCMDRERGMKTTKLNPFLAERLVRWAKNWRLEEVIDLQGALAELDFQLKQTPRLPLGIWSSLIFRFCR